MAKKRARRKKSPPKNVSVTALHREIRRVKKKIDGARTRKATTLKKKLTKFAASIDCGPTLLLDIGS